MAQRDLLELATHIGTRLADVTRLLAEHDLDSQDAIKDGYPTGSGFEQLTAARLELLKAANDLQHIVLGREEWLKVNLAVTKFDHLCYYMIDQYKIYQSVPLTGDIAYEDLSKACGLPVDPLRRILRHAILNDLFCEPRSGYVTHSDTSSLFATDPKMASWLGHNYDEVFPSLTALPETFRKYPNGSEPGQTAFGVAFDQPKGFFPGLLQEQPWRAARFAEAMQAVTQGSHDPSHLVNGHDWECYGDSLVVDVGGSTGHQSVAIAKEFPDLQFVVQDIEDHSLKLVEQKSAADVKSEMQFQVHDFFKPNPQISADIYLLRHIIHDWADENAAKILKNIAVVMKPGARIIVVDIVVPEPGTIPWQASRMTSFMDLQMMVMVNGKERNKQEWINLVTNAHPGLRILRITQPLYSVASIIEIGCDS